MSTILSLTLFLFLALCHLFIGKKISKWITISRLGFSSETPEAFLRHPAIYRLVSIFLFFVAFIPLLFTNNIIIFFGLIILLSISLIIAILGRKSGIKLYRNILQEMLDENKDLSAKEREEIKLELTKPDSQIFSEKKHDFP